MARRANHVYSPAQVKGGNILFVRGETQGQDRDGTDTTRVVNPDEINIDEDDDIADESGDDDDENRASGEDEEEEEMPVQKQSIPSEVFGSLKRQKADDSD
ncbi:hypothetical protein LSTR_LSTR006430 [Laodelphax striatellus]|uniref:Uncharacterized protein n=1 Tax=Laodelphax striatellus TaxID=195883 RepID=A0A482WXY6_LAOST|nr:hypothetical protein LSTR_LSTR006430 [Laodelphax striatellus]